MIIKRIDEKTILTEDKYLACYLKSNGIRVRAIMDLGRKIVYRCYSTTYNMDKIDKIVKKYECFKETIEKLNSEEETLEKMYDYEMELLKDIKEAKKDYANCFSSPEDYILWCGKAKKTTMADVLQKEADYIMHFSKVRGVYSDDLKKAITMELSKGVID